MVDELNNISIDGTLYKSTFGVIQTYRRICCLKCSSAGGSYVVCAALVAPTYTMRYWIMVDGLYKISVDGTSIFGLTWNVCPRFCHGAPGPGDQQSTFGFCILQSSC